MKLDDCLNKCKFNKDEFIEFKWIKNNIIYIDENIDLNKLFDECITMGFIRNIGHI